MAIGWLLDEHLVSSHSNKGLAIKGWFNFSINYRENLLTLFFSRNVDGLGLYKDSMINSWSFLNYYNMECFHCSKTFSTKHSLASHKNRYHRNEFKSVCLENKGLLKDLMKKVLYGEFVLKKPEKDRLKIVRDGIRKIVYEDADIEEFLDRDMENAIKLILKICKITLPNWGKRIRRMMIRRRKAIRWVNRVMVNNFVLQIQSLIITNPIILSDWCFGSHLFSLSLTHTNEWSRGMYSQSNRPSIRCANWKVESQYAHHLVIYMFITNWFFN